MLSMTSMFRHLFTAVRAAVLAELLVRGRRSLTPDELAFVRRQHHGLVLYFARSVGATRSYHGWL